ncbi:hypothetical protein Dimus_026833 [Dionaea muscipula]
MLCCDYKFTMGQWHSSSCSYDPCEAFFRLVLINTSLLQLLALERRGVPTRPRSRLPAARYEEHIFCPRIASCILMSPALSCCVICSGSNFASTYSRVELLKFVDFPL